MVNKKISKKIMPIVAAAAEIIVKSVFLNPLRSAEILVPIAGCHY